MVFTGEYITKDPDVCSVFLSRRSILDHFHQPVQLYSYFRSETKLNRALFFDVRFPASLFHIFFKRAFMVKSRRWLLCV
jgi:hypothetical protein